MTKNVYFGPNLAVFGPKIQILTRGSKSFGAQVTEKPPRYLVRIVYWSGMGLNVPKNANIWPKKPNLAIYGPKILIFMGVGKSFGTNITETT